MPEHVAIQPGTLYPQPDYSIEVDEEGKWTITHVHLCHSASIHALLPRPHSPHPDFGFIGLRSATARVIAGDLAEITCVYAGADSDPAEQAIEDGDLGGDPDAYPDPDPDPGEGVSATMRPAKPNAVYKTGLTLSQEPLLSHPAYKEIDEEELRALQMIVSGKDKDDQGNDLRDGIESELGKKVLTKLDRGQTHYYAPRITFHESYVTNNATPPEELNNIGKIAVPPGPAPSLAGGRNWLLVGFNQTREGNSFRIESEFLSSDRRRLGSRPLQVMSALPPRKKPGDPILAADWNAMIAALEARTPRPGSGLSMVMTPEGFCYSQPGGHPNIPRQSLPPFSVISITRAEEEGFEVIIKEGWVIERNPKSDAPPAVKFHMPVSGEGEEAIALDTIPRPKIPMNLGDTLWCRIKTDDHGRDHRGPARGHRRRRGPGRHPLPTGEPG